MYYSLKKVNVEGCTANITRNRNRAKIYGDSVYLKNGENFEIELFNPSTVKVLAKISLNGKQISNSGIVLKPGQRVYLERFIDTNNKFLFETYEVEKSNEALNAIIDNGLIEVDFYQESDISLNLNPNTWSYTNRTKDYNVVYGGTTVNNYFTTTSIGGSLDSSGIVGSNSLSKKDIETGRVEMGESSGQKFDYSYGNFNSFPSKNIKYRMLPESEKPVEASTIRNYCTDCGFRMKKQTWKFCPNCGSKF